MLFVLKPQHVSQRAKALIYSLMLVGAIHFASEFNCNPRVLPDVFTI